MEKTQQQEKHKTIKLQQNEITLETHENETTSVSSNQQQTTKNSTTTTTSSSSSSSPSHEFSFFTVSLHNTASETQPAATPQKMDDLTPADEIFFHGHLLPLHFTSHTNSRDDFTLPAKQPPPPLLHEEDSIEQDDECIEEANIGNSEVKQQKKPFSIPGIRKWRNKPKSEVNNTENQYPQQENKKRVKFEYLSQFLKRYINMVKPLLSTNSNSKRERIKVRRQSYSFSGVVSSRDHDHDKRIIRKGIIGKRGEFSAPASMGNSPNNSGVLNPTKSGMSSPVSDSTMEELQSAIQAAIAHCKNSIANQENKSQHISVPVN